MAKKVRLFFASHPNQNKLNAASDIWLPIREARPNCPWIAFLSRMATSAVCWSDLVIVRITETAKAEDVVLLGILHWDDLTHWLAENEFLVNAVYLPTKRENASTSSKRAAWCLWKYLPGLNLELSGRYDSDKDKFAVSCWIRICFPWVVPCSHQFLSDRNEISIHNTQNDHFFHWRENSFEIKLLPLFIQTRWYSCNQRLQYATQNSFFLFIQRSLFLKRYSRQESLLYFFLNAPKMLSSKCSVKQQRCSGHKWKFKDN